MKEYEGWFGTPQTRCIRSKNFPMDLFVVTDGANGMHVLGDDEDMNISQEEAKK